MCRFFAVIKLIRSKVKHIQGSRLENRTYYLIILSEQRFILHFFADKKMEKFEDFSPPSFLEELEVFRWRLCIAKDGTNNEKLQLCEKACSKPMCELYIEECVIAGFDMSMVHRIIFSAKNH